jgi:hypothetical protein
MVALSSGLTCWENPGLQNNSTIIKKIKQTFIKLLLQKVNVSAIPIYKII